MVWQMAILQWVYQRRIIMQIKLKKSKFISENSKSEVFEFYCDIKLQVPAVKVKVSTVNEPIILVNSQATLQDQCRALENLGNRSNTPTFNIKSQLNEVYTYILESELKYREMNRMLELAMIKMDIKRDKAHDALAYIETLKTETVYTGII
jgi:hypothetical protein